MDKTESKLKNIVESGKPRTLNYNGKKVYISKSIIEKLREKSHEGGVLPLLALLPAILGGIGAAAGTAGGIATAVNQAKQARKTDLDRKSVV